MAAELAVIRSDAHDSPEYLEEAIYRIHASLGSTSVKDTSVSLDLEDTAKERFRYFGSIEGVEASSDISPSSQPMPLMTEDDDFPGTVDKMESLLFWIRDNDDTTKIDEAIEKGRSILTSCSPTDPSKTGLFFFFGKILEEAFWQTDKIEYLNESIIVRRQLAENPFLPISRFDAYSELSLSLLLRLVYFSGHRTQDRDEALELLSQCVSDARGNPPDRFFFACIWAWVARLTRHPSVSTAYETAVSLMQDTLLFPPTLQLQHATLAISDEDHSVPLDYASHQVDLGQLEAAIETLERGRALLWSEMRHFHTSIDQLLETDPDLGHKFAAVIRELEELTKSVPPSHKLSIDEGPHDDLRAVDKFGRLVLKQCRLMKERDKLVSQIRL